MLPEGLAYLVSYAHETLNATPSNAGDVNLGVAAAMLGRDHAMGRTLTQIGSKVANELCERKQ